MIVMPKININNDIQETEDNDYKIIIKKPQKVKPKKMKK